METIKQILKWHQDARPEPTLDDVLVQVGCHIEEFAEMMGSLLETDAADECNEAANRYKRSRGVFSVDRHELLEILCNQIVTAIGVARCLGLDIEGALTEVARSNDSHRRPDGSFLLDEGGNIIKGDNYSQPNLSPYF